MQYDVRSPATMRQLAAMYSNPNKTVEQIDGDLFMNAKRGHDYIHDSARDMGISNPVQHFGGLRAQQELSRTQSGAQTAAMHEMGAFTPGSLPAQLQSRDAMWDKVTAGKTAEAEAMRVARLQQQDKAFPLPMPGQTPVLTPLQTQAAQFAGQGALGFVQNQRLASNRFTAPNDLAASPEGRSWAGGRAETSGISPNDLYRKPEFQTALQRDPRKAGEVFESLTGAGYKDFIDRKSAADEVLFKDNTNFAREGMQSGKYKRNEKGIMTQRMMIPDPDHPEKLIMGSQYGELDEYSKGVFGSQRVMSAVEGEETPRLRQLRAIKDAEIAKEAADAKDIEDRQKANLANGVDPVFQTKKFALLQKTNPQLAALYWEKFHANREGLPTQPLIAQTNRPRRLRGGDDPYGQ